MTLTSYQMKEAEKLTAERGLSYFDMMENAGSAAFDYICKSYDLKDKACVILTGAGNNGGDGYVLARKMLIAGADISVLRLDNGIKTKLCFDNFTAFKELGGKIYSAANGPESYKELIDDADIFIDAVFGTGFRGTLDKEVSYIFRTINRLPGVKIALDVESGVNADGKSYDENAFAADTVLTFAAIKPAYKNSDRKVVTLNIGICDDDIVKASLKNIIVTGKLVGKQITKRDKDANKGDFGRLLNIAGSQNMLGAAMMSTLAAMRCGNGITVLASAKEQAEMAAPHLMEAITLKLSQNSDGDFSDSAAVELLSELKRATACSIGCGLSQSDGAFNLVRTVLDEAKCPLVIDADALNCISKDAALKNKLKDVDAVLTPHPLEMARLAGISKEEVINNKRQIALNFAKEYGITLLLKGSSTIIATPYGDVYENTTGNPALAKGGSGDVLTGMIASFLAQGMSAEEAAFTAMYLHGRCADRLVQVYSEYSVLARDIIEEIPYTLKKLEE